jgi:hypothetical protein
MGDKQHSRWNKRPTTVPGVHGIPQFKIIRSLISYCEAQIIIVGLDPWAWFRTVVDDVSSNTREVLHQGVYETMYESMSAY